MKLFLVVQIVQPPMDFHLVTFDNSTSSVQLMCSLNIDISSNVTVTWLHNGSINLTPSLNAVTQAGNTTTLQIENLQPLDAGVYQCVFNDTAKHWVLKRNISRKYEC